MIFYLKHTKGKGIFSNFSSSKQFYAMKTKFTTFRIFDENI